MLSCIRKVGDTIVEIKMRRIVEEPELTPQYQQLGHRKDRSSELTARNVTETAEDSWER